MEKSKPICSTHKKTSEAYERTMHKYHFRLADLNLLSLTPCGCQQQSFVSWISEFFVVIAAKHNNRKQWPVIVTLWTALRSMLCNAAICRIPLLGPTHGKDIHRRNELKKWIYALCEQQCDGNNRQRRRGVSQHIHCLCWYRNLPHPLWLWMNIYFVVCTATCWSVVNSCVIYFIILLL